MSPRKAHIETYHQTTVENYFAVVSPTSTQVILACYPELSEEWRESESPLLFASWLSDCYSDLVKFVRTLSETEKRNLMIAVCNE